MKSHVFKVNLEGVLDVLSNHLYSSEQVFVRELLQNGCDAIAARRMTGANTKGLIQFELITGKGEPQLIVEDDGIGLTAEEVELFLSSVGSSTKREYFTNQRENFIGQFGIGLLSCFMVTDTITIITRAKGEKAIKWIGKVDGTYETTVLENSDSLAVGTKVFLKAKKGKEKFFQAGLLQKLLQKYSELLPIKVNFVVDEGEVQAVNLSKAVWENEFADGVARDFGILEYGKTIFEMAFQDFIEINIPALGVKGVAYIIPYGMSVNHKQTHRVFLKRMFLSDKADNILPDWCFFVRCVLNVQQLRPTASREGFYEDEDLMAMKEEIGYIVRNYFIGLAKSEPEKLERLLLVHHDAFKLLAVEDDDFFEIIMPFLRFHSTKGEIRIDLKKNAVIQHVPDIDAFRKIAPVASAQGLLVLNSGYMYDSALLKKLNRFSHLPNSEVLDIHAFIAVFTELSPESIEKTQYFMQVARKVLTPFKCKPEIKSFEPTNLPGLYYMSEAVHRDRAILNALEDADELWGGVLNHFLGEYGASQYSLLCFNYENPLIRRIAAVKDGDILENIIGILYVNALLLGHHPLDTKEMGVLNHNVLDLIDWALENRNP